SDRSQPGALARRGSRRRLLVAEVSTPHARIVDNLRGLSICNDGPGAHDGNLLAQRDQKADVVLDYNHAGTKFTIDHQQQLAQAMRLSDRDAQNRLVEQNNLGTRNDSARNFEAPLVAERE